jgi:hypothetical protein
MYLTKARATLSSFSQLNIQSPETGDVKVYRKLNLSREIIHKAAQDYPMPALTASIAITKLNVGACLEMMQRFCFEYFKQHKEQEITVVFLHNHKCEGDNHVFVLLGPTIIDDNLVMARGGNAAYVPEEKYFMEWRSFLNAQPAACVLVDPLLNLCSSANAIPPELSEYCEQHKITGVIGVKLYHHSYALLENLDLIEKNANILAALARRKMSERLIMAMSPNLLSHREEENRLRAIKLKYPTLGNDFEKILRNAANKEDIETIGMLIQLKEKQYISMEIDAAGLESGATALHYAVKKGNESIIRLLLSAGADVEKTDNEKHDAMYYAQNKSITLMLLPSMLR